MKTYKFKARIEPATTGDGACVVFPYDVEKEFSTKGRVPVKASFDGVPYTGSLIKYGSPQHILPMLKGIREQVGKELGDTVEVTVQKDLTERTVEVPDELMRLLKQEGLLPIFEKLSFTHRKEYCRWISDAKKEETRQRRLVKAAEMLRAGIKTPDSAGARIDETHLGEQSTET